MTLYKGGNVVDSKADKIGALRRFGIELEVSDAPDYHDLAGQTVFGSKSDGSVHGDGLEFVSPILQGDAGLAAVENLCAFAESRGWDCDRSCGYHLHIDVSDLEPGQRKRVYYAYRLTEALWYKFVSPRRASNSYCLALAARPDQIRGMGWRECIENANDTVERYGWCNIVAYDTHKTIEIRLHHGTIGKDEVVAWIKAHLRFVEIVRSLTLDQLDAMFAGKSAGGMMLEIERLWKDADLSRFFRRKASNYKQPVHA
jgi:hypothetical protein